MPKVPICSIEVVRHSPDAHRGIGFLVLKGNRKVTAKQEFESLPDNERRWLETSFDWWMVHVNNTPQRLHGWNKSQYGGKYTNCFVFKAQENRLYGFLCHPNSQDPRYYFCVLVVHATKHEWESEEGLLKDCEAMRLELTVQRAARTLFEKSAKE